MSTEAERAKAREAKRRWRAANREQDRLKGREQSRVYRAANREKANEARRVRRLANLERERDRIRAWQAANPEKQRACARAWREANPERDKERARRWYAANPDKASIKAATQKAARLRRTPPWADLAAIEEVYREAAFYRAIGVDVHVDHYYPLQGRLVSGLHVANNLRVIIDRDNLSKGNKMPEEVAA